MKTSFYITFLALLSLTSSKRNLPKVDIYIESLCDECVLLIKTSILEYYNFNYELGELNLIPYGKATEEYNPQFNIYKYECQHGMNECYGNLMQTCIIKDLNDIGLIICLYQNIFKNRQNFDITLNKCLKNNNEEKKKKIYDCMKSKRGNFYQHEMALKTKSIKTLKWIPHIIVDDKRNIIAERLIKKSLLQYFCDFPENDCKNHSFLGYTPYETFKDNKCKNPYLKN